MATKQPDISRLTLHQRLVAIIAEVPTIEKNASIAMGGALVPVNTYDFVISTLRPVLDKYKILTYCEDMPHHESTIRNLEMIGKGKDAKPYTKTFFHYSGIFRFKVYCADKPEDFISVVVPSTSEAPDSKVASHAYTIAHRQLWQKVLRTMTGENEEAITVATENMQTNAEIDDLMEQVKKAADLNELGALFDTLTGMGNDATIAAKRPFFDAQKEKILTEQAKGFVSQAEQATRPDDIRQIYSQMKKAMGDIEANKYINRFKTLTQQLENPKQNPQPQPDSQSEAAPPPDYSGYTDSEVGMGNGSQSDYDFESLPPAHRNRGQEQRPTGSGESSGQVLEEAQFKGDVAGQMLSWLDEAGVLREDAAKAFKVIQSETIGNAWDFNNTPDEIIIDTCMAILKRVRGNDKLVKCSLLNGFVESDLQRINMTKKALCAELGVNSYPQITINQHDQIMEIVKDRDEEMNP